MVPTPLNAHPHSTRLLYTLLSFGSQRVVHVFRRAESSNDDRHCHSPLSPKCTAFAALIPILVLMSGVFAGLTLGYMSLDETQLNVLSVSGTP